MSKETPVKKTRAPRKPKATKGLYEKMFNVQADLQTVLKSAEHGHSKYMYATERDFIAEIKPLLKKERLLVVPNTKDLIVTQNSEGQDKYRVCVDYILINADKPEEKTDPVTFWGSGEDKKGSVVGLPIAYTMSLKYFLAKTFIAETGTDAEAQDEKEQKNSKGKGAEENPEQATATIMRMLAGSRNVDGIREYLENRLPKITKLTKVQKEEIKKAGDARLAQLEADHNAQDKPTTQGTLIK